MVQSGGLYVNNYLIVTGDVVGTGSLAGNGTAPDGGGLLLNTAATVFSDARLKRNVSRLEGCLDRLRAVQPVYFSWLADPASHPEAPYRALSVGANASESESAAYGEADREGDGEGNVGLGGLGVMRMGRDDLRHVGFLAQEVRAVLPEAVEVMRRDTAAAPVRQGSLRQKKSHTSEDERGDETSGYLGMSYVSMAPVVIEAIRELVQRADRSDAASDQSAVLAASDVGERDSEDAGQVEVEELRRAVAELEGLVGQAERQDEALRRSTRSARVG